MDCEDRSNADASSLSYGNFISTLMYYGMTKQDILNSSQAYLYTIYQNYPERACENLGVSSTSENEDELSESDYPSEFREYSQKEREEYVKEISNEDFLAQFDEIKRF